MQAYKTYARVQSAGQLALGRVPFPEGTLVEVLVVEASPAPGERVEAWRELMRATQALPQAQGLEETDMAAEIEAVRTGR